MKDVQRTKTIPYQFLNLPEEMARAQKIKDQIKLNVALHRGIGHKLVSGGFLLLDRNREILGYCALACSLFALKKKQNSWQEFDFLGEICPLLGLSRSEAEDFILGFDGLEGREVNVWYLLGAELRAELKPEDGFQAWEK